jgi:hypothetical protein
LPFMWPRRIVKTFLLNFPRASAFGCALLVLSALTTLLVFVV